MNYEEERKKPIRWMSCTCCGTGYRGRQWWNMDTGYGLGDCCVDFVRADRTRESRSYGVPGIHFLIPEDEESVIDPEIGVALHDLDPRLRIDDQGYVFWRGHEFEHWSGNLVKPGDEEGIAAAKEMIRRCEILEAAGQPTNTTTVIWSWKETVNP